MKKNREIDRLLQGIRPDSLDHDELSQRLLFAAGHLDPGLVLSIESTWGRGKTDLLLRVVKLAREHGEKHQLDTDPVWLEPWRYKNPDLLTPLVRELYERCPKDRMVIEECKRAAGWIIRAGTQIALAAASTSTGGMIGAGIDSVRELTDQALRSVIGSSTSDALREDQLVRDPVAELADQFQILCRHALGGAGKPEDRRLLVAIDDLDRCLPHQQVALLEAIHFVIAAKPQAIFLIAIDPRSVREAITTHYGIDSFDSDKYLEKIFDLRTTLRPLSDSNIVDLIVSHLDPIGHDGLIGRDLIAAIAGADKNRWHHVASNGVWAYAIAGMRTPRFVDRSMMRLRLLLSAPTAAKSLLEAVAPLNRELFAARALFGYLVFSTYFPLHRDAISGARGQKALIEAFRWHGDPSHEMSPLATKDPGAWAMERSRAFDREGFRDFIRHMSGAGNDSGAIARAIAAIGSCFEDAGL